jgi:hypothetical protein
LVQDVHHEDQSHHVFAAELLHGLLSHRALANLHVCVENLDLMACEKMTMGAFLFHPFFSPSRFSIF